MFRLIRRPVHQPRTERPARREAISEQTAPIPLRQRPRLALHRFCLAGFGTVVSVFGLALTVSTLAMFYAPSGAEAGAKPYPGEAVLSYGLVFLPPGAEAPAASVTPPFDGAALEASFFPAGDGLTAPAQAETRPPLPSLDEMARQTDNVRLHALSTSLGAPVLRLAPEPAPRPAAIVTRGPALPTVMALVVTPTPIPPAATPVPEVRAAIRRIDNVNITFYDCAQQGFCGLMANGRRVYEGAAACSYNLTLGTRFYIEDDPTRRVYRCEDRGLLSNTWVDIFWYHSSDGWRWQEAVGRYGAIVIVEWGTD